MFNDTLMFNVYFLEVLFELMKIINEVDQSYNII